MSIDLAQIDPITDRVIAAAILVHKALGPGLLESAYTACLFHELRKAGLKVARKVKVPVHYDGVEIDCAYELDLLIEDVLIVEVKALAQLAPIHTAQLLTYLRLTGCPAGLLINFNVPLLRQGLKRVVNGNATRTVSSQAQADSKKEDLR